jgi:putative ATP-dependent endonuclease of OLD family
MRSKLIDISIKNLGCIGNEGLTIALDNILCLVGNNNTGKSTVLRAYELAVGAEKYDPLKDRCKFSNQNTIIEITVHIPEGIENIAEKWKDIKGDLRLVRSKWLWDENGNKIRQTYDPELGDYTDDGNAAGLDNVFNSRLPIPFRIGALASPEAELKNLLKLIVDPISVVLRKNLDDVESELSKALEKFNTEAAKPVNAEKEKIEKYGTEISKSHASIFPNLGIDLSIGIAKIEINPIDALLKGSDLNITEFEETINWSQQGTGSKRALFWSLLQVRSKLQSINDLKSEHVKKVRQIQRDIKKLERERDKAARVTTKEDKQDQINSLLEEKEKLETINAEKAVEDASDNLILPGYMLLIDEPEVALHPNGVRAASKYLYELAKDNTWQVMLTTHSPLFINPFEDNTTIVRLSREAGSPSPKTYRSDSIEFSHDEKDQLTLLNTFDQNLAEMFFGQYPLIVEGDTEFAAFQKIMSLNIEKYPISQQPLIIRARGKFTISPIIKMLTHFKVNFSVLHDSDYPKNKNGEKNGVWTYNKSLCDEIEKARSEGLRVLHRISISTFEIQHLGVKLNDDGNVNLPSSKGKPFIIYKEIAKSKPLKESIEKTFDDLIGMESEEKPFDGDVVDELEKHFIDWVKTSGINDPRFNVN